MSDNRAPALGDLELAVMGRIWDAGAGDAKSLHTALGQKRGITLNTIQSTLKRLYEKGLLKRTKVSHAHIYDARVSREQLHREALRGLTDELMSGKADAMIAAFVDLAERAGPTHLDRLAALIAERKKQLAKGRQ